jgi:hypothetical protein
VNIEHCVFLSWFRACSESHEQDGETLSLDPRNAECNSVRRSCHGVPNLGPWRKRRTFAGLLPVAGGAYRRRFE